jgi:hypothetical protein
MEVLAKGSVVQKLGKIPPLKLNLPLAFEVLFMFLSKCLMGKVWSNSGEKEVRTSWGLVTLSVEFSLVEQVNLAPEVNTLQTSCKYGRSSDILHFV